MRVKVTPENIEQYGLDVVTGNTMPDLYAAMARAEELGEDMYVVIPDVEGGDTEAPTERNTFDHYSEVPDPDGRMHEQEATNLTHECQPPEGWGEVGDRLTCQTCKVTWFYLKPLGMYPSWMLLNDRGSRRNG